MSRDELPIVTITRALCPYCQGDDLTTLRSRRCSDGSSTRRTKCNSCAGLFIVICEPCEPAPIYGTAGYPPPAQQPAQQ